MSTACHTKVTAGCRRGYDKVNPRPPAPFPGGRSSAEAAAAPDPRAQVPTVSAATRTAAAAETLSDSIFPEPGIRTRRSQAFATSGA